MAGKKLTALEMPDEEYVATAAPAFATMTPVTTPQQSVAALVSAADTEAVTSFQSPASIPLPPIPAAPVRRVMVQLSIKAPVDLVDRLETMANATRAQKQAIIAAALDAYMLGHGY